MDKNVYVGQLGRTISNGIYLYSQKEIHADGDNIDLFHDSIAPYNLQFIIVCIFERQKLAPVAMILTDKGETFYTLLYSSFFNRTSLS